jgi:hypothetical protein
MQKWNIIVYLYNISYFKILKNSFKVLYILAERHFKFGNCILFGSNSKIKDQWILNSIDLLKILFLICDTFKLC